MTELEGCIRFWKAKLAQDSYLMEPSATVSIQNTVKYLEELQRLKEPPREKDRQDAG